MEIASGSLGHGLPLGVRLAHGLIARGLAAPRVYVLVGDAELDEGSNSEAIVYAGAVGLPNLTVVAVDNRSSSYGWGPGGIEAHFAVSGWSAVRVSGRDHAALGSAFLATSAGASSGSAGGLSSWWPPSRERGEEGHDRLRTFFAAEAASCSRRTR